MLILHEHADVPTPTSPMRVHVIRPAGSGRSPGLIFFSEIYQVTGPIAREAAWLAGQGYAVAMPEIYHEYEPPGTVLAYDKPGTDRGNALKTTKPVRGYDDDARAAVQWLAAQPFCSGKVGAIGNCIGGHLALRAALNPEVSAAACFYATDVHKGSLGAPPGDDTLARLGEIRGELLMIFGRQDPHVPWDGRRLIHERLEHAGVSFQWLELNAQHAFMRDEGHRYDPAMSRLCLNFALELFARRLSERNVDQGDHARGAQEC